MFTQYSFWIIHHKENRDVHTPATQQHLHLSQSSNAKTANKDVQYHHQHCLMWTVFFTIWACNFWDMNSLSVYINIKGYGEINNEELMNEVSGPPFLYKTYLGFPSTSVSVRCFFKSACFTSMSLSSGLMKSRLEWKIQKTKISYFIVLYIYVV